MHYSIPEGFENWACCSYLRKSREDDDRARREGLRGDLDATLERHQQIINEIAADNGHSIARWYREVISGETIANRVEIKELLHDVANGQWDAVYVVEVSRLGRGGGGDQEKIVNVFRYSGTWIITPYKLYDPDSAADMKQLKNELRNSEDELDSIKTRLTRGRERSAKRGIFLCSGRPPYGWRAVRINGQWTLEPDENHEHMLRIYDLLEAGYSFRAIRDIFRAEGVPTQRGGTWSIGAIQQIARNPVNCGYIRYGYRKTVRELDRDTFEVRKRIVRDQSDYILVKGLHFGKGGISKERFDRIMAMCASKPRAMVKRELINPFAGLLFCGKCGYAMNVTAPRGERKLQYVRHKDRGHMLGECEGQKSARLDIVMDVMISSLEAIAHDMEMKVDGDTAGVEFERHKRALEDSLADARDARRRALEAYEAGVYSVTDLKERKDELDARIRALEEELGAMEAPEVSPEKVASVRACIDALKDDAVSVESKNKFLRRIVKKVVYWNDSNEPRVNRIHLDIFLL